jgi:hypothetical protein
MLDLHTAEQHGICPRCQGYGGGEDPEACYDNPFCPGACPKCWCEGCRDGWVEIPWYLAVSLEEQACGSWQAYLAVQAEEKAARPLPRPKGQLSFAEQEQAAAGAAT